MSQPMDSDKRQQERCADEAGEPLTLFVKDGSQAIHGLIVDWSMNGLAIVVVSVEMNLEVGQYLSYSPDLLNLVSFESPENIDYNLARIKDLGNHIYLLGLQAL